MPDNLIRILNQLEGQIFSQNERGSWITANLPPSLFLSSQSLWQLTCNTFNISLQQTAVVFSPSKENISISYFSDVLVWIQHQFVFIPFPLNPIMDKLYWRGPVLCLEKWHLIIEMCPANQRLVTAKGVNDILWCVLSGHLLLIESTY